MSDFSKELNMISSRIESWNGDNLNDLLPTIRQLQGVRNQQAERDGLGPPGSLYEGDEAGEAFSNMTSRTDLKWPSPWDKEGCEFAYAVDRKNQYLSYDELQDTWYVSDWEPGTNCLFDHGAA